MATKQNRFEEFERALGKYAPKVHWLNPGATEQAIANAEEKLKVKFPPSYREFLSRWNGAALFGTFTKAFAIHGKTIRPEKFLTDDLVHRNRNRPPGAPEGYLAVGTSNTGDTINLDLSSNLADPPVVRLDHESGKGNRKWKNLETWLASEMKSGAKIYDKDGNVT